MVHVHNYKRGEVHHTTCRDELDQRRQEQQHANEDEQLLTRRKKAAALKKLVSARNFAALDREPCKVIDGLYVGGIGTARNIKSLRKAGVRYVLNASPVVPRFHPEELQYKVVQVFDDPEENIAQFFEECNEYIDEGRRAGGLLVHCYAGQSRSVALIMAYLMAKERMSFASAWAAIRAARPCAKPNSGFMGQLADYAQHVGAPVDLPLDLEL